MTENREPTTAAPDRAVTMFGYVGIAAPGFLTVAALIAQLLWIPQAPNPIAVHWGSNGADGAGSAWVYPISTLLLGFGLSAWLWATALPRLRRGSRGWSFRMLAALAAGLATFGSVLMSWCVRIQVGLDSWHDAPGILAGVIVSMTLAAAVGIVGWYVQPKQQLELAALPQTHLDLAQGERAAWLGVARAGRGSVYLLAGITAVLAVCAVAAWVAAEYALMWIMFGSAAVVAVSAMAMLEADVRVDAQGLDVRGPAGWPHTRVPLGEVASAAAVTVEAFGAFGGWGWRRVPGALGVVLRSGEALRVERKEGPALVVTVDDAATAAALLEALAARAGD